MLNGARDGVQQVVALARETAANSVASA
jgi:hypothetical protein